MKLRRFQYNIDYIHIISFREEYKNAVIPFFGFDNLRYGVDNENTINESIRLIFKTECIAISLRKEGITFIFEGEANDLRNQNGVIKIFFDLFEQVKKFRGFKKTARHSLICHGVKIIDSAKFEELQAAPPYFVNNPFGKTIDFGCHYDFEKDSKHYKFDFGGYTKKEIEKYDLTPFKTDMNKDLIDGVGLICRLEIKEKTTNPSFSKFKSLLKETELLISSYDLKL